MESCMYKEERDLLGQRVSGVARQILMTGVPRDEGVGRMAARRAAHCETLLSREGIPERRTLHLGEIAAVEPFHNADCSFLISEAARTAGSSWEIIGFLATGAEAPAFLLKHVFGVNALCSLQMFAQLVDEEQSQ